MKTDNTTPKNGAHLWWEAATQSWAAWTLLILYLAANLFQDPVDPLWAGALALGAILLAMNGLARTELWLTSKSPMWFRKHPVARVFHHINNEGELAGIFVASLVLICQLARHQHPHFAFAEAFVLLGIMSAANIAVANMMPIMSAIERVAGKWGAIVTGSLLSSFTGEPSAAVFLSEYFKGRTPEKDKEKVATGLAATIGSGGGLLPFSAPPVLIVWAILGKEFGWGLGQLLMFVGGACVLHVVVVAWRLRHVISNISTVPATEKPKASLASWWPLVLLAGVVVLNMSYEFHHLTVLTWGIDGLVGVCAVIRAYSGRSKVDHERNGEEPTEDGGGHGDTHAIWQPFTLALLLMGLEVVGVEAEPLLKTLAAQIPATWPVWVVALILWYLSAFTSHFADNALASRVYITAAVALAAVMGHGDLLAMSVVLGALFGGFLLIPANLPNFAISARFGVTSSGWARVAWRWYWTGVVHVVWILGWYFLS